MVTAADRQATAKYHATHIKRVPLNLNDRTDQDIIAHLQGITNVQGYLKALIRADIDKGGTPCPSPRSRPTQA